MEHEEVYALMMEALDGELSAAGQVELESHLRARPELGHDWKALQAVDRLLRETPPVPAPAGFARRTVRSLPATPRHLWVGAAIYFLFLAAGIIPLLGVGWLAIQLAPALGEPALWSGFWQGALAQLNALGVIVSAAAGGAAQWFLERPAAIGLPLLMVAIVLLWGGVLNRLVLRQERA
jgi:anti-sigma factor RsiW